MVKELAIARFEHIISIIETAIKDKRLQYNHSFICMELFGQTSTDIRDYFIANHPSATKHEKFYNHPTFNKSGWDINSWWIKQNGYAIAANKQRVKFLKYLIKQLNKEICLESKKED